MSGRKRTAKGKIRKNSTKTGNSSDSDSNEESISRSSKQIKSHIIPSQIDSNNELLKENPFLIPKVVACLCGHSSRQALLKYRLVGQHMWNEFAVDAINEDKSVNVRLVKLFDLNWMKKENMVTALGTAKETGVVIDIDELLPTLRAGGLEKSTLTRIYLHSSIARFDLNEFLQLNGENIRTLHYDGGSLKDLRKILQTCANDLTNLSLWSSWEGNEDESEGIFKNQNDTFKLNCLETLAIASGEMSPHLSGIGNDGHNMFNPSKEFLTDIFQASPNLKSLSARFYDSFILDSGLSYKNLTTLCIKFKIGNDQLRALCEVGLRLKSLRLQGIFIAPTEGGYNRYTDDPEWMEFRQVLLNFIQTQANTLEYFAVCLFVEKKHAKGHTRHNTPLEQWSSRSGFPTMPNLNTFILYECSGKIPKAEFGYLFPKLRNLEIVECWHKQFTGPPEPEPNVMDYPLQISISANPAIFVRNIRGIKPTMELAKVCPGVIELHIEGKIPHGLPYYWPKLKHLYYKDSSVKEYVSRALAKIRKINRFLVGISPEESKWIEGQGQRSGFDEINLELPRSHPSIFNLNELETFEFEFVSYEYDSSDIESALRLLITLGLSRLTHLKKLNFVLEQKPRPSRFFTLPVDSLNKLKNTFCGRKSLNISTNCNATGSFKEDKKHTTKKWTLKMNLDHHKSEWKEIDGLFREDPDICELGLPIYVQDDIDKFDY